MDDLVQKVSFTFLKVMWRLKRSVVHEHDRWQFSFERLTFYEGSKQSRVSEGALLSSYFFSTSSQLSANLRIRYLNNAGTSLHSVEQLSLHNFLQAFLSLQPDQSSCKILF